MRMIVRWLAQCRWTCLICQNVYSENDQVCPYCN
jgi:rubrerythrin